MRLEKNMRKKKCQFAIGDSMLARTRLMFLTSMGMFLTIGFARLSSQDKSKKTIISRYPQKSRLWQKLALLDCLKREWSGLRKSLIQCLSLKKLVVVMIKIR